MEHLNMTWISWCLNILCFEEKFLGFMVIFYYVFSTALSAMSKQCSLRYSWKSCDTLHPVPLLLLKQACCVTRSRIKDLASHWKLRRPASFSWWHWQLRCRQQTQSANGLSHQGCYTSWRSAIKSQGHWESLLLMAAELSVQSRGVRGISLTRLLWGTGPGCVLSCLASLAWFPPLLWACFLLIHWAPWDPPKKFLFCLG